jgi:hypothetical protein
MVTNTDYSKVIEDVTAAAAYVRQVEKGSHVLDGIELELSDEDKKELLFRAGLRLMRAESGMGALSGAVDRLDEQVGQ